jgi:hypothetical protein
MPLWLHILPNGETATPRFNFTKKRIRGILRRLKFSKVAGSTIKTMARIPWSKIREAFDGEWVELTDCSWGTASLQPTAARVRFHNSSRANLMTMIERAGRKDGSVVLFVGPSLPAIPMSDGRYSFSAGL